MENTRFTVELKDEKDQKAFNTVKEFMDEHKNKYGKKTTVQLALRMAQEQIKDLEQTEKEIIDKIP